MYGDTQTFINHKLNIAQYRAHTFSFMSQVIPTNETLQMVVFTCVDQQHISTTVLDFDVVSANVKQ